jgi:hypothetical protein
MPVDYSWKLVGCPRGVIKCKSPCVLDEFGTQLLI